MVKLVIASAKPPKASSDDIVIPPPSTYQVEAVPRVVLYTHDGKPLQRKTGF